MKNRYLGNRKSYDILLLVKYITRKSFFGTKKAGGNHEKEQDAVSHCCSSPCLCSGCAGARHISEPQ